MSKHHSSEVNQTQTEPKNPLAFTNAWPCFSIRSRDQFRPPCKAHQRLFGCDNLWKTVPENNAWHSCMSFLEGEKLLGPKLSSLVMAFKFAMSPDPLKALSHPCNPKRSVGRCPDGLCSFAHSGGAFCSPNVLGAAWMSFLGIFCSGHCNGFKGNHNKNTFHGVEDRIRCRTCCDELTLMVNLQLWSLSQCSWREQHWKHSKIKRAYLHLPHPAFTREAAQHSHFLSTCKLLLKLSFEADTMWPLASWFPKAWLYIFSGNMQHQGPFHLDSFVFCSSSHEVAWLGQGATHAVDSVIRWIGSNDWTCQAGEVLDPSEFLASEECSAEEVPVIFGFPDKKNGKLFPSWRFL